MLFFVVCLFFQDKTAANTRHQSYSLIEIASTGHCSCVRSAERGTHRRLKEPCQNQIPAQRTKHVRRNTAGNRTPLRLVVVFLHDQIDHLDQFRVNLVNLVTWNFWESCNANDIALFALLALWMHESAKSAESAFFYKERLIGFAWKRRKGRSWAGAWKEWCMNGGIPPTTIQYSCASVVRCRTW